MAWGGRVYQVLGPGFTGLILSSLIVVAYLRLFFGKDAFDARTRLKVRTWHKMFGMVWPEPECVNPFPAYVYVGFVLLFKIEISLWHVLDFLLVCIRFCFTMRWPAWSRFEEDVWLHSTSHTGLGDLIADAIFACETAKHYGIKKVCIDWRFSSYLTEGEADLFEALFDIVSNPQASAQDPQIMCWADRPQSGRPLHLKTCPRMTHVFGHFSGGKWIFQPRTYLGLPGPSHWTSRDETHWPDDPLDQSPPPFPSVLYLPINRGCMRRVLRDNTHFTNSIRLKQPFLGSFEEFKRTKLDGRPTVGVHVRAGNGEKGHFVLNGRGKVPIDEVHPIVESYGERLGSAYQVLLMSDTSGYIEAYQQLKSTPKHPVITRPQWKPPPGDGAFFVEGSCMAGVVAHNSVKPPDGLQLAADAAIDSTSSALTHPRTLSTTQTDVTLIETLLPPLTAVICLGYCDVFLSTAHSMFTLYPAKLAQKLGHVAVQLNRDKKDHEGAPSLCALLEYNLESL